VPLPGQSNGIEHQEAKAMAGVCIVQDLFHEDIDPNTAMSQVTSLAMSDLYYLPPGTVLRRTHIYVDPQKLAARRPSLSDAS
jgi:hypothetical protein